MAEHPIRFRGGWEWHDASDESGAVRRVSLPLAWPVERPSRVRLVRRFHRPPLDPQRDALLLRLEAVEGLEALWLNERELARPVHGESALLLPVEQPLPARNVLVLDVEPISRPDGPLWGEIALVIRPIGS